MNVSAMEGPIQTIVAIVRPDTEVSQDDSVITTIPITATTTITITPSLSLIESYIVA